MVEVIPNTSVSPPQSVASLPATETGFGLIVISTVSASKQPNKLVVIINEVVTGDVVVFVNVTTGSLIVALFKPEDGVQL